MSTINRTRNNLATDTVKGQLLNGLTMQYVGSDNYGVITLGAAATDRETITITAPADHPLGSHPYRDGSGNETTIEGAKDVYQVVLVGVDTGETAANDVLKNTNPDPVQLDIGNSKTSEGKAGEVGTILAVGSEYLNILEVSARHTDDSPIKVIAERGYAGSTITSHAATTKIMIQADSALTTGALPIPTTALAAATLKTSLGKAIQSYSDAATDYEEKIEVGLHPLSVTNRRVAKNWLNVITDDATFYLHYQAHGEGLVTMEGAGGSVEQMTSSSNTLAAFVAGTQPLGGKRHVNYQKVSSGQASGGMKYIVPFEAKGVLFEDFGKGGANGSSRQLIPGTTNQNVLFTASATGTVINVLAAGLTEDNFVRITAFG